MSFLQPSKKTTIFCLNSRCDIVSVRGYQEYTSGCVFCGFIQGPGLERASLSPGRDMSSQHLTDEGSSHRPPQRALKFRA